LDILGLDCHGIGLLSIISLNINSNIGEALFPRLINPFLFLELNHRMAEKPIVIIYISIYARENDVCLFMMEMKSTNVLQVHNQVQFLVCEYVTYEYDERLHLK
jgi:hypothetical protein